MNSFPKPGAVWRWFHAQVSRATACWSRRIFLLALLFFVLSTEGRAQDPFDYVWVGAAGNNEFNDENNWNFRQTGLPNQGAPRPGYNAALSEIGAVTGNAACDYLVLAGGIGGSALTMAGTINVLSLRAENFVIFEQNVTAPDGVAAEGTVSFNGTVTGGALSVLSVNDGQGGAYTTTTFNKAVTATDHSKPSFLVAATAGIPQAGVAFFAPGSSLDSGPMSIGYFSAGTLNLAPGVMAKATTGNPAIAAVTIGALDPAAPGFGLASLDGGAVLEAVGDTYIGVGSQGILVLTAGGQVKTSGQAIVGMSPGGNGAVTLQGSGSKWEVSGNLIIGEQGTGQNPNEGHVFVSEGAMLTANGGFVVLGKEAGSLGTLTLDGGGSKAGGSANLEIGRHGDGTLEVLNGATIGLVSTILGVLNDGSGTIKVDGVNSKVSTTGSLTVGGVSKGTLKITGGGQMLTDQGTAIVGRNAGVTGKVTLAGQNSRWTINGPGDSIFGSTPGNLTIGKSGTGTVTVSDHANLIAGALVIGQDIGSTGTLTVTGSGGTNDSKLFLTTALTVGDLGNGSLILENGATFENASLHIYVAQEINSSGQITVDGGSSALHVSDLDLGDHVGSDGQLKILNGGKVTVDFSILLGHDGTGSILVGGTSSGGSPSTLTTKTLELNKPSAGLPALSITAGGQVSVTASQNASFTVRPGSGNVPTVRVNGAGSQLSVPNLETFAAGAVALTNGASATLRELNIGSSDGQAKVSVGGDPSTTSSLTIADKLSVGGGTDNFAVLDIGAGGVVNVTGLGTLYVGTKGQINIHDSGARLSLANTQLSGIFSNSGTINITGGGAMNLPVLALLDIDFGGTVQVSNTGSQLNALSITLSGNSSLNTSDYGHIAIGGLLDVQSGATVNTNAGGSIDIGSVVVPAGDGEIVVQPLGKLKVNGSVNGHVIVRPLGSLSGSGTINGDLINKKGGAIGPGNSPGRLTIQGNYTQESDALLRIELGGATAGSGYDQLQVSGTANIAGNLDVWLVNGFTPAVGQTFRIVNASSFSGSFSSVAGPSQAGISVSNDATGVTVTITSVVAGAPVISSATTVSAAQGAPFSYQIAATNKPTSFGAMNLPDGLTVDHASGLISGIPAQAGNYAVPIAANNDAGSGQAVLTIEVSGPVTQPAAQLLNIATRMRVLTGDNVLIGGFIITGTEPKKVIIRGIGPSLGSVGISGALVDPILELHQDSTTLVTNDNWKTRPDGSSQQAEVEATTIPPTNDFESAIVTTLNPGAYTAILADKNGASGVGVVELYDLAQGANSKLANISSRGFVDTGDNVMIGGVIVGGGLGGGSAKVIVRAIGPSLSSVGVSDALQDPTLELRDGNGAQISSNDNWKLRPDGSSQQAEIEATTIPPADDRESALVASLPPGNHTAIVRGVNNTIGIAVVEVYNLP